jgi:AmmeMemoRadiSam system protein B
MQGLTIATFPSGLTSGLHSAQGFAAPSATYLLLAGSTHPYRMHTFPLHHWYLQAEHSLELHTPYIKRSLAGREFTLVPIMVGSLTPEV